jgi:hypothetical protein
MTVLSAQQPELAFKISAPDLIVFTDAGQGPAIPRRSALSLSVRYQAFTLEDIADSAGSRNGKIDVMIEEPHPQFFRAPVRVFLTQGSQVSDDLIRNRPGVRAWCARPVRERGQVRRVKTLKPFVAGFAADTKKTAKSGEESVPAWQARIKSLGSGLSPGHSESLLCQL